MAARRRDVAVVALEGAGQHPELVSGRWPRGGGAPETALNEVLAAEPGVRAGDSFTVRTADRKRLRVRIGGLYRIGDPSPALWTSVAFRDARHHRPRSARGDQGQRRALPGVRASCGSGCRTPGSPAYGAGLLVALLVWPLLPALTWRALRDPAPHHGHAPVPRRAVRRLTAEAVVLLLAVAGAAGVAALRSRGTEGLASAEPAGRGGARADRARHRGRSRAPLPASPAARRALVGAAARCRGSSSR
ncbi:hypothetical protein [Streptomyces sp. NPDC056242]|uniref:hypothetical protein n=1 Tax=Streptomyces sp. NPDC056242 TaxID=3345760 RepID=UPI0035D941FA